MATAVVAGALLIYVLTADRDLFPGDQPEFATVALTGGVAHPPGYPLLTMLGALFGAIPLGPLPFRVNLVSVLSHAAAVGVVFLIAERLTRNLLASAAGALVVAFGVLFWKWSLVAEAFPLNDLLALLVLYFLVVWHERPEARWPLYAAAATFGLGVANHQTITLLVPGYALIVLDRRHELRGRARLLAQAVGVAIVAAALPYAYIPVAAGRHEILNWGSVQSLGDLVRQFLRLDYGTGQLIPLPNYRGGTGIDRLDDFALHVNPAVAVFATFGFVRAWQRLRWYFWASLAMLFITGPAFLTYADANVHDNTAHFILVRFYLLPQVIVAPMAGLGIAFIGDVLRRRAANAPAWSSRAVAGVAMAVAAIELVLTYGAVDRSQDHAAHDFAMDILATAPQDAVVLASGDHVVLTLAYVQGVENVRPDVTVVPIPLLPYDWYQRDLKIRHPDLKVPLARYEQADGLRILIDANPDRNFFLTGEQRDYVIGPAYGTFPGGLLLPVIPASTLITLSSMRAENDTYLASYRIPTLASVDRESFEHFILDWYALVAYRVGFQLEQAKQYADARSYFQRALAIQPELPEAIEGMRRIQGK